MKKLPLILAATTLVASIGAYAQPLKNDAACFAVNVPDIQPGFQFNVQGLFLQPTHSDGDYGLVSTKLTSSDGSRFQDQLLTVKPNTNFTWGAGIGYVFPESGNDVQLNWLGFNHNNSDSFRLPANNSNANFSLFTPFGEGSDGEFAEHATGVVAAFASTRSKLNVVDLNVGQYLDVGTRLQLRPFAGVRFANIESNLRSRFTAGTADNASAFALENDTFNSKFNGVGPLTGVEANYHLGGGMGASAQLATALLTGKVKTSTDYTLNLPAPSASLDITSLRAKDVTRVVPAIEAKLALNWSPTFMGDYGVALEGGYKVTQYINAVDRLKGGDFSETNSTSPAAVHRSTSSVGFSGPYIKLSAKL